MLPCERRSKQSCVRRYYRGFLIFSDIVTASYQPLRRLGLLFITANPARTYSGTEDPCRSYKVEDVRWSRKFCKVAGKLACGALVFLYLSYKTIGYEIKKPACGRLFFSASTYFW